MKKEKTQQIQLTDDTIENIKIMSVSILTGLSNSAIQKLMDDNSNPTMQTMEKLASGLKAKIECLYDTDFK